MTTQQQPSILTTVSIPGKHHVLWSGVLQHTATTEIGLALYLCKYVCGWPDTYKCVASYGKGYNVLATWQMIGG